MQQVKLSTDKTTVELGMGLVSFLVVVNTATTDDEPADMGRRLRRA